MESDGCDEQDDIHFVEVPVSPDHVWGQLDISKVAVLPKVHKEHKGSSVHTVPIQTVILGSVSIF